MRKLTSVLLIASAVFAFSCKEGNTPSAVQGVEVTLHNPILPGFHPDPSVVAVGEDYYLVNSTFQYFPGVPVYHSRDLQNWEQIGNVLTRPSQVNLSEATSWSGIYAPTIRYHEGTFYMITTNVSSGGNFMVTATDPAGPWSDPVFLEQGGIDPSLYFEDGKCYMVSNPDGAVNLCEIDPVSGKTLSPSKIVWKGTGGRFPESPHIYKKDGWYYLMIAEGGTELPHKITVARSRKIYGPYESNPSNPILTHCSQAGQDSPIQGTGHGDLFQSADGAWWIVFLAYRRYGGDYHHLGRETFLAPVTWEKGWPVINDGKIIGEQMQVRMAQAPSPVVSRNRNYSFEGGPGPEWMHLQEPVEENYSYSADKVTLKGNGVGLDWGQWHPTTLLRRQQSADCEFFADVTLTTGGEAGMALYQINCGYATFLLRRSAARTEAVVKYRIRSLEKEEAVVPIAGSSARLAITSKDTRYAFILNGKEIAHLDSQLLSTEAVGGFTGVTLGLFCQSGTAEYTGIRYREILPVREPVTPGASKEAKALLAYLYSIRGAKVLSGQHGLAETELVKEWTGKYPAIRGLDLIHEDKNAQVIEETIAWWRRGGIPTLMWHWGAPGKGPGYENSKKEIDIDRCFEEGTPENQAFWADLERIAGHLTVLRDAGVPVLWRPLHECDGNWFWYGKGTGEQFNRVWRTMFDYFAKEKKLNNLIWVLCHCGEPDSGYNPGEAYYDLAGADSYNTERIREQMYRKVVDIHGWDRPIPYHECGTIPDPDLCGQAGVDWSWWMLWSGEHCRNYDPQDMARVYAHDRVLTLEELPDIMSFIP